MMIKSIPLYISPSGGSIVCFVKDNRRIFQSCSAPICSYSRDLHSAKNKLKIIESNLILTPQKEVPIPLQRKTTLKWNIDGELSVIDKARVLSLLSESKLTQCELGCDVA